MENKISTLVHHLTHNNQPPASESELIVRYNKNGNYRRGFQKYFRGGVPKGWQRLDDNIFEFVKMATVSRGWDSKVERGEAEWLVEIIEEGSRKLIIHIPFNEDNETTFEWDAQ